VTLMSAPPADVETSGWFFETPFDSPDFLSQIVALEPPSGSAGIALFVAGGPLSGKSSVLAWLTRDGDSLIPPEPVSVDPYGIREYLPEWQALSAARDPAAATGVRDEVLYLAGRIVTRAVAEGRNLVIDGIGNGGPGVFCAEMQRFHGAGYEVRILMVDTPLDVAHERNETRAAETGRFILPSELERLHRASVRSHLEWRDLEWVARWEVYST